MNPNDAQMPDFEQLLSRHFDGVLSAEESSQLAAQLKADPARRRQFARASLLHDQLRTAFLSDLAQDSLKSDTPDDDTIAKAVPGKRKAQLWRIAAATIAAAAVVLVAIFVPRRSAPLAAPPVAILSAEIATQWADPNVELLLRRGDLPGGPLRLESGVAEFAFADGGTALIQGPAVFEPLTARRLSLTCGRAIGRCSSKEAQLTIVTPGAEVTDLGTEFGVAVGDDRNTQVAVIQGEVKLVAAEQVRRMKAGESVAIDSRGKPKQMAYAVEDLSRLARLIPGHGEAELGGENLLTDPQMSLAPVSHGVADAASPWKGTAGHVDLVTGRAHAGNTAIRIRALGNPMWPLVGQDVKTGPVDGQVVAASIWAMQPAEDPLAERQNAIVKIMFLDAAGHEFARAERYFLHAAAPRNEWFHGQIAAKAPPGTAALRFQVLLNARGQKSGAILVDDARLSVAMPSSTSTPVSPTKRIPTAGGP